MVKTPRAYADTSVFGGCFDQEFANGSRAFFEDVRQGLKIIVLSDTTLLELRDAPARVRDVQLSLPLKQVERVIVSEEIAALRDAYIAAGVVGASALRDAEHIAAASVAEVDFVVSWNFRHIVHYQKIDGYNAVNLLHGYKPIRIFSPWEVIGS